MISMAIWPRCAARAARLGRERDVVRDEDVAECQALAPDLAHVRGRRWPHDPVDNLAGFLAAVPLLGAA
jgi:hypothetical protein